MNKDLKDSIDEILDSMSEGRGLCEYIIDVATPAMFVNMSYAELKDEKRDMYYFVHGMLSGLSALMDMIDKQDQLSMEEMAMYINFCFKEAKAHEKD